MGSRYNHEKNSENTENDIKIIEARHRTSSERRNMNQNNKKQKKDIYDLIDLIKDFCRKNKKQVLIIIILLVVIAAVVAAGIGSCSRRQERENGKEKETTTQAEATSPEAEPETEPQLTLQPEAEDSEIAQLIASFYNAYIISGDVNEVGKYIDSANSVDANRLSINKKYIESVSGFSCYKSDLDIVDDKYTILIVTYKVKLYNYDELLPSIDILFLVNGEAGYKVHNLTVDDEFDRQKIENDQNFQILAGNVSNELSGLLAANPELNEVYNLYLNPDGSGQQ